MEHPRDCLSDTEALEGTLLPSTLVHSQHLNALTQDDAEETNDDWASPPSPPPEDRLPKRSKLDDLVETESNIKAAIAARPSNQYRGPIAYNDGVIRQLAIQMDQARLARLERKKAETAAIIAAAAAAQQAEEQRALLEAAAAAEARSKEEERLAERERRKERKERKEREGGERRSGSGGEDNREKRLLKLVGAVVVKTMSKYRARMDVDTFKKHAKEVRASPLTFLLTFPC